jgi:hypothetical protein
MPEPTKSQPSMKELLERLEALETQNAALIRAQGQDSISKIENRLESQDSLNRKYAEVRRRNLDNMLPESRFRALARGGDASGADATELKAMLDESKKRIEQLETIVLERETDPKGSKRR